MSLKLAELFVQIGANTAPFTAALAKVKASIGAFASNAGGMALGMVGIGGAAAGIAAAGLAIRQMVMGASDLNETINKTKVIFGDSADVVIKKADEMADKYGIVKTEWMDTSSEVGNLLQGMGGMGAAAAAELTTKLGAAAADASSIFNKSFPDAIGKISSALRGESQPISEFGIDLQEAAVHQEALRLGLVKGSAELTTQQKVAARSSLILNGLKVASGDLENTQGGFANSFRAAWGRIQNLLASVGQALMPIFEGMMHNFNRLLKGVQYFVDAARPYLGSFAAGLIHVSVYAQWIAGEIMAAFGRLGASVGEFVMSFQGGEAAVGGATRGLAAVWTWLKDLASEVFNTIGVVWRNWSLIAEETGLRVSGWIMNLGELATWLGGAFRTFLDWFGRNWTSVFADGINAVVTMLQNLGTNFINFGKAVAAWIASGFKDFKFDFKPMLTGVETTLKEMPDIKMPVLSNKQEEIDAVRQKMLEREQARQDALNAANKGFVGPPKPVKPGVREPLKEVAHDEKKESKSSFSDLTSFAKRLQEGALDKESKKQTRLMEEQAELQRQIARNTSTPRPALAS